MAGTIGFTLGFFAALVGVAYLWLGFLMLIRVQKRWPVASMWSAVALGALLGVGTTFLEVDSMFVGSLVATIAACGFVLWRGSQNIKNTKVVLDR